MTRSQAPRSPAQRAARPQPGASPDRPAAPPTPRQPQGNTRIGGTREPSPPPREPGRTAARSSLVSSALGFVAAAVLAGAAGWASGCHGEAPPGPSAEEPPRRQSALPAPPPTATPTANPGGGPLPTTAAAAPAPSSSAAAGSTPAVEEDKPYTGPLLGAQALQTPVYPTMEFSKKRLGYIRRGGKVPVDPRSIKAGNCPKGWYRLLDGGYVCGKYATIDVSDPQVRLGITPPNLEDVLPYKYAYNTGHGTPLYRSVPSKEEMFRYEPYLEAKKKKKKKDEEKNEQDQAQAGADAKVAASTEGDGARKPEQGAPGSTVGTTGAVPSVEGEGTAAASDKPSAEIAAANSAGNDSAAADKAAAAAAAASLGLEPPPPEEEEEKPWWQRAYDKDKPLNVTLAELEKDADGTVAKRMVKGFFVAVDKTFGWNDRLWYKTTSGLVAPTDRMYLVKPPDSHGIDFPAGAKQVGFITASKASKYEVNAEGKKVKVTGSIPRFAGVGLTGETATVETVVYRKTTEGWWMKGIDGAVAEAGPPPADLAPGEKWVDVNLTRKTLVAMEGDRPVFATLVSPGRRSKTKKKDHPTKTGTFRIREKHIAVTMDGDGTVAGDLPYSIEDVPFVAYYDGSYALHGAFWHNNFGREMSHGCVNLSPLDAKRVFFWTEPRLPRGWHAAWSTPEHPGTLVNIHE